MTIFLAQADIFIFLFIESGRDPSLLRQAKHKLIKVRSPLDEEQRKLCNRKLLLIFCVFCVDTL